jgi:hypothetical protein
MSALRAGAHTVAVARCATPALENPFSQITSSALVTLNAALVQNDAALRYHVM